MEETYGEDSYLSGEIAMSYVKGLQGGNVLATVSTLWASPLPNRA